MTLLLSQDEIKGLTGLEQPAAQEKLLRDNGLRVFRNAVNKVVLSREAFVRWQLGESTATEKKEPMLRSVR